MRLVNVYRESTAVDVLYALLQERQVETRISHQWLPSASEHRKFVESKPYRYWYLIRPTTYGGAFVGELHATHLNEIGVCVFAKHRGHGYGTKALRLFMARHRPLRAITSKRVARWLANIAIRNEPGKQFFAKMGFERIQETFAL